MSRSLWDPQRQGEYLRQRDAALTRRNEERDGFPAARDFAAIWSQLADDARLLLRSLARAGADSCIGRADDPLLLDLGRWGLLARAPGVRPVLTPDLLTSFQVPPAVWEALRAEVAAARDVPQPFARITAQLRERFGERFALVVAGVPAARDANASDG